MYRPLKADLVSGLSKSRIVVVVAFVVAAVAGGRIRWRHYFSNNSLHHFGSWLGPGLQEM